MPKNDEGSIRWGCKYLVPNARSKQHRTVKLDVLKTSKDESERWHIIFNPGALWTFESAQFSACDNFSWGTRERQAGRQTGRQAGGQAGNKLEDKLGDKLGDKRDNTVGRWTHPPTKGNKKEDKLAHKLGDKRDKDSGRRTNHPKKGKKKGDSGRQGEDGHTTQQRETRRETSWEIS